jgi:glycogen(starch) synthase
MPGWEMSRRWRMRHRIQGPLERRQTERSAAVIASSQAILDWARRLWTLDRAPTVVLPNAVHVERTRSIARSGELPEGYPDDRAPVVAFSGRLESRKGVHILAEAMDGVWQRFPDARLVLMGEDRTFEGAPMSEHLRRIAGERQDRLHVLGRQPPERLFPAIAAADVVVLPSLWENFALAGLEIMALGKPLIVSDAGGFPEMVRDEQDGLLFPPGDARRLGAAITRLLEDEPLRERLGQSAERRARETFDATPVAERHVAFFQTVVDGA